MSHLLHLLHPALPSIEGLIRKHIHYLHSDEALKKAFSNNKFSVIYKRNKNLKEMVAPSLYPKIALKVIILLLVVTNVTFVKIF